MKQKVAAKRIAMVVLICAIIALVIYTAFNPTDVSGEDYQSKMFSTFWALVPPLIAIILSLITKEVYSSLFVGVLVGALFYTNFDIKNAFIQMVGPENGFVSQVASPGNAGILVFLVLLGIMVALMNKAGGSRAFGIWTKKHIKTRIGAQIATIILGVMIFVDDYFNCLTVGSVMRPVTDSHKVSRAKLAYIIDATAAPVCIIAPISSWAAAVASYAKGDGNGIHLFIQTIPYNYYALLTIFMMLWITVRRVDYGPMRKHEENAIHGDLFTTGAEQFPAEDESNISSKGKVIDLVLPVIVLIAACVVAMIYTGGFFDGEMSWTGFVDAFSNSDATVGLALGGMFAVLFTFFYYMLRDVISFKDFTDCIPEGFKAMIAPCLILIFAWTLCNMTSLLGGAEFVQSALGGNNASFFASFLPAVIFLIAIGLSFSTGTSWGTFGILIPIVLGVFPTGSMRIIGISACLAGAVCGDHCSPISDTTIMASAGAQSNHINHVSTQLPYALTVAAVSFVSYILAGLIRNVVLNLVIAFALMAVTLIAIEKLTGREEKDLGDAVEESK